MKLEDIYKSITDYKDTLPELVELEPQNDNYTDFKNSVNSGSNVAVWRWFAGLFAYASYIVRVLFEKHKIEVENLLAQKEPGTLPWYVEQLRNFQQGYALEIINGRPAYSIIDEDAKVIKYAAGNEVNGQLLLKVAADDGSGNPEAVNAPTLSELNIYIQKKGFAGVKINLVSLTGDLIYLEASVYVDGLLINGLGQLISDTSVKPVELAILQYYKSLPFNGVFNRNALIDSVQDVNGVVDFEVHVLKYKIGSNPYNDIDREYNTISGYVKEDPANSLSDGLNYII